MIPNGEKSYSLALSYSKKTISIIKKNKSKNNGDFYCLN